MANDIASIFEALQNASALPPLDERDAALAGLAHRVEGRGLDRAKRRSSQRVSRALSRFIACHLPVTVLAKIVILLSQFSRTCRKNLLKMGLGEKSTTFPNLVLSDRTMAFLTPNHR